MAMIPEVYDGARELLYGQLSAEDIERWLAPIGFSTGKPPTAG